MSFLSAVWDSSSCQKLIGFLNARVNLGIGHKLWYGLFKHQTWGCISSHDEYTIGYIYIIPTIWFRETRAEQDNWYFKQLLIQFGAYGVNLKWTILLWSWCVLIIQHWVLLPVFLLGSCEEVDSSTPKSGTKPMFESQMRTMVLEYVAIFTPKMAQSCR